MHCLAEMRLLAVLAAVGFFLSFPAHAFAADFQTVLQRTYVRAPGKPVETSDPFTACDPQGTFRLVVVVVNGYPALVHEGRFAAVVPVDPTVTKLTATLSWR